MEQKMKIILINIAVLLLLSGSLVNMVNSKPLETEQDNTPPLPTIVFLYPSGLENNSDFLPGDYIYFTLTGNLSLYSMNQLGDSDSEFTYQVEYQWNDLDPIDYWQTVELHDGIGVISPFASTYASELDVWHSLSFRIYSINRTMTISGDNSWEKSTVILENTETYNLYANSSLISYNPLSITPISFANDSVINVNDIMYFQAEGSKLVFDSFWSDRSVPTIRPVVCYYKWDTDVQWDNNTQSFNDYVNTPFNVFEFVSTYSSGDHVLYLKIENDTDSVTYDFHFTASDTVIVPSTENYWWENTEIDPQIELYYPLNDVSKSGLVPIIWSLDTLSEGFVNYSTYKFDLYYETDVIDKTLIVSDYNPLKELPERKIDHLSDRAWLFILTLWLLVMNLILMSYLIKLVEELPYKKTQQLFISLFKRQLLILPSTHL